MLIYLLRHGETDYNREKRYQGVSDIPLSERGRAKLIKAGIEPPAVYISPFIRTRETAAILFPHAKQIEVPGLREMNFGEFEGRNYIEMEHDAAYRAWVEGGCEGRCPGGDEDKAAFCRRICDTFAELVDDALLHDQKELVIVAHGGTQMAAMEQYALPRKRYFEWQAGNAAGFVLSADSWKQYRMLRLVRKVNYTKDES